MAAAAAAKLTQLAAMFVAGTFSLASQAVAKSGKWLGAGGKKYNTLTDCWHPATGRVEHVERCWDFYSRNFPPLPAADSRVAQHRRGEVSCCRHCCCCCCCCDCFLHSKSFRFDAPRVKRNTLEEQSKRRRSCHNKTASILSPRSPYKKGQGASRI